MENCKLKIENGKWKMKNKKIPEIRFPEFSGEWIEKRLGEVCEIIMGQSPSSKFYNENNEGLPLIQGANDFKKVHYYTTQCTKICNKNDIIMSVRAPVGKITKAKHKSCIGRGVCAIKGNDFIYYSLIRIQDKLKKCSQGSTFESINSKELKSLKIHLPPTLTEQKKIADFLSSIDEKIEIVTKKIEKLKEYKKGLLQKLLNVKCKSGICAPELRFKEFSGSWVEKRLGEILKERKEYSIKNNNNITHLTLSKDGIFPKTEQFNRDFLVVDENKKYKITYLNDICYNPANLKFGVIGRNKYGKGIFSPIYITFEIYNANPIFIENIVTSENFINKALKYQEGTVYERMAVKPKDLLKLPIFIPPTLAEQEKIAEFLLSIDKKIELEEEKLNKLKEYKKGLIQKLLNCN